MTRQLAAAALAALALVTAPVASAAPEEDEPGWSCATMGNRVCGPDGDDQPGCYSDAGALVAPWPCYLVINPDGSSDVFTPDVAHGVAASDGGAPGPVTR